jgi:uncharacterized protein YqgC (DUF456 family)
MATAAFILLVIFFIIGFFSILFGLPGTWVVLIASFLYDWTTGFARIGYPMLAVLLGVALLGELLEYLLGMAGARRFGASRKGAFASLAGGIIGAILCAPVFFGVGALLGLFAGAFLGAFLYEWMAHRDLARSMKSGLGAFLGRLSGTMVKLLVAGGMIAAVLFRIR